MMVPLASVYRNVIFIRRSFALLWPLKRLHIQILTTYEKSLMFGLQRVMFVSHKRLKGGKFKNKWGVVVQHQNEITRLII